MPRILSFYKSGREERIALVRTGKAPRDFFYGIDYLINKGYDIKQLSSSFVYEPGMLSWFRGIKEKISSLLFGLVLRPGIINHFHLDFSLADQVISFTDGFSITLGHFFRSVPSSRTPFLIGCFHGLSDLDLRAPTILRPYMRRVIEKSLGRLDHIAFFGPADRSFAIEQYNIDPNKASIIRFGVDTDFWQPAGTSTGKFIFSIGQDPNRDFTTLVNAEVEVTIRIHTELPIAIPKSKRNIELTKGSYQKPSLTDEEIRRIYQESIAVVVPLKDVHQPTGYSVTLQAMACGKPVILSRIRGLWAPELLVDGENCILVTPGDSREIADAINRIIGDADLRQRIGLAARKTVLNHFSLHPSALSTERLFKIGFEARSKVTHL